MEELYPKADRSKWDFIHVEDEEEFFVRPEAFRIKRDKKKRPVGVERRPQPPSITLTTDALDNDKDGIPEIAADGRSTADIIAKVRDARGRLVRKNVKLTFRTTGGALSKRRVVARRGKASVQLRASRDTVLVTVSASAEGMETATLSIELLPPQELI